MARDEAVRITTAGISAADEMRHRQRRYLWSMGVRTVCFVGAIAIGPGVLRWVLIAAAVFLPYIAVVMANAADRTGSEQDLVGGLGGQKELPTNSRDSHPFDGRD
jgi:hypothetical protein